MSLNQPDVFAARAELKFLDNEPEGTIGGWGAVFGNRDSHGDVIMPGAFVQSLAEHKASGTAPRMYVEHSAFVGGDPLPIGVWDEVYEEGAGLRVKGRLIGQDHPDVKRVADLMRVGALGGFSIAFTVPQDGAVYGKSAADPRRTLNKLKLISVDVVSDPSNPRARVDQMKSIMLQCDQQAATAAIGHAMQLHHDTLSGGNAPSAEQRDALMGHLQMAHMALTGSPMPKGTKARPTLREAELAIRTMFGLSHTQAREITDHGLKSWLSRDESNRGQVTPGQDARPVVDVATRQELAGVLEGFSLSFQG